MEQTGTPLLLPLQENERIESLDVMRGIVLCGILLMNINAYGLAEAYIDPTISGGFTGLNKYTWIMTNLLFEGTMRGLFSLLFGVGMFIFLDRLEKKGAGIKAADIFFRRLLWLLVFGIIHGYLFLWPGEILFDYAIMGFLVYSFRHTAPKKLFIMAVLLFTIGGVWNFFEYRHAAKLTEDLITIESFKSENKELTKELEGAQKEWEKIQEKRSPEFIQESNETSRKGYLEVLAFRAPVNMDFEMYMFYRYNAWDILSMMLVGIGLFKLHVLSAQKSYRLYWAMVLGGYGIGLSVNYFELKNILDANFSYLSFAESNVTYDLGRLTVSMGHVGLIMLFCKSQAFIWLKKSIAAVGKMALTNYFMHSVICIFVFTGVGFGLFGKLQRYELLYVVFGTWIFQLILSPIWLKYYEYGPLEWIWRNLSYQKVYPFRKSNPS
ncbi:DUF418 domain-containing protein [Algoriphagus sp. A40]|uniref:DUF418 domain-containing protein n=1 Tax=Algoriphagus sp. A40 TaxID=1945863 RepID=UPI000987C37B|nr:DUF418 domain-containing protein [Algoriphagus sp. A40]OOG70588.1 hypothetical protein B0E43_18510 [Algoriphagus sp. A40]